MQCANCGSEVHDGARFCISCGAPIANASAQADPYANASPQADPYANASAQADPYANSSQQAQPGAQYTQTTYIYNTYQTSYPRENSSGLLLAAFIFNLITTICVAVVIIPLAWCIPMTVHSYGVYKGTKPNTVGFGVCTLLFLSLIGGILMLVAEKAA